MNDWVHQLTAFEARCFAKLMSNEGKMRRGNGPWERVFVRAMNPQEGRAFAKLHELGLIQREFGRPLSKIGHCYRWRSYP